MEVGETKRFLMEEIWGEVVAKPGENTSSIRSVNITKTDSDKNSEGVEYCEYFLLRAQGRDEWIVNDCKIASYVNCNYRSSGWGRFSGSFRMKDREGTIKTIDFSLVGTGGSLAVNIVTGFWKKVLEVTK